ncbi:SDR family NAD(P)-dependent oxidoreductase [Nicoliella lavandulae]|uniref:SDR family NAD(P)-dependent oxidoreductase n=1 Tax=Nicoliella lavandulae TaxID=3082954 RepID=A0ABU8SP89_9LACO
MTKTWLITGTSTGFGKELALQLAKQGEVNLIASARKPAQLAYLDQYDHGQIIKAQLDVTKNDDIKRVVNAGLTKFGSIDVLVNNAGLGYFSTLEESDEKQARYLFDVNFWGVVNMTKAVLPSMRKQRSGIIVNLSSIAGIKGTTALSFYNASKHAVEGLTKSFQQEVSAFGIKCMLVEPSAFRTDWAGRSSLKDATKIDDYKQLDDARINGHSNSKYNESGDPVLAAKIIIDQVQNHADDLPLHLPLGKWAIGAGLDEFKQGIDAYHKYAKLAESADDPLTK